MDKQIVVSGIRPTGTLHLGNYLGAIVDFVRLQNTHKCFFFVADYHALTTMEEFGQIAKNTHEIVTIFLAAGLDPNKCTIFVQSAVPEIPEIALLLSRFQPGSPLLNLPTYTEEIAKNSGHENAALLYYPVLMAADILAHKASLVPVGSDQEINIRVARDIARRFNNMFGKTFPMPETFERETIRVPGLSASGKMGKSAGDDGNINLIDSKEVLEQKIRSAITDPQRKRRKDSGNPFICNIYTLHEMVSPETDVKKVCNGCQGAEIGCIDCKILLVKHLWEKILSPIQKKRTEILQRPATISKVLYGGNRQARTSAKKTLKILRTKMGLSTWSTKGVFS